MNTQSMRLGDRAGWGGKVSRQQVNQPWFQRISAHIEQGEGHRQFEPPAPGASRVQVKLIATPFDQGLVGMAGDDQSGRAVEEGGDVGDVVDQQGGPAVEVEGEVVGEIFCPRQTQIIVAAHGVDRSDLRQFGEDLGAADVASVEDKGDALDRGQRLRAEEAVGVGDDGGFHGGSRICDVETAIGTVSLLTL